MTAFSFTVNTDHHQFYLEDTSVDHDTGLLWQTLADTDRLDVLPGLIAVGTSRYAGDVTVVVEVQPIQLAERPSDLWDHIVECSIAVRSGQLTLTSPDFFGENVPVIAVHPGTYRVRVYYGSLDSAPPPLFLEGTDHYLIELWPDTAIEPRVLKQKHYARHGARL